MLVVNARIRINRDLESVFAYVAAPENFPEWNSAVTDVRRNQGPTYVMTRQLPTGTAINELHVVATEPPLRFAIETTSGPTPFHYTYAFSEENGVTTVDLHARVDLGALVLLGPLARRGLESGIKTNLAALAHILET